MVSLSCGQSRPARLGIETYFRSPRSGRSVPTGDVSSPELLKREHSSNGWAVKCLDDRNHSQEQRVAYEDLGLIGIDCWEEILDPPDNSYIFRAKDNWLARLAL